jgi:integrase
MALSLIIQRRLTPQIGGLICSGIPGRFAPEWVADLKRNQWPFWCGILIEALKPMDDDALFASRKGKRSITIQCVNNMVKKWVGEINLKGNYGAHSLRKTWGYVQRTAYGVGFEILCKRFNHSSPAITMRYLGIEDKEVQSILMNEVG